MQQENSRTGSEDTRRNEEAVQNAAENRDALAAEARRVAATAPAGVDRPVEAAGGASTGANRGTGGSAEGGAATMRASEDTSKAREHVREAAENRDALAEEARRVSATTPTDADRDRR